MRNRYKSKKGFTLIELIIVVAIIAILAAVSVVMYSGARERGYITEAKGALMRVVQEEENYKAEHGAYPPAGDHKDYLPFFGGKGTSGSGHSPVVVGEYDVAMSVETTSAFTVRATPKAGGKMIGKKYGWLEIDQDGVKKYYDNEAHAEKLGWPYE